jgi:hypothetical protein
LVQLKTAVPWQRPNLIFYAGAANPPLSELQADVDLVTSTHITLASDPSQDPWSHHLYWDGLHWLLSPHSAPSNGKPSKPIEPVNLGQELTTKSLSRVPSGAILWFDPPLAREIVQALLPPADQGEPPVAAKLTNNRSAAMYVIGAKVEGRNISFAWFKRKDIDSEVQTPKWMGAGCSPGSSYPLRTDWIDESAAAPTAAALTKYAIKLAKLNGWYLLQSSSLDNHQGFPYSLILRSESGGQNVGQNGVTSPGKYYLYLEGKPSQDTQPRWVYVLNISCQGDGIVVWPFDAPPGKISQPAAMFPIDDAAKRSPEIPLPGYPFPVGAPFGTDTYILLTTSTPLTNYHALAFDSVVSRNVIDNPLEDLLDNASQGTRDAGEPIPTDWGVWSMQVQSIPNSASQL